MQCRYCKGFNAEVHYFEANASVKLWKVSKWLIILAVICFFGGNDIMLIISAMALTNAVIMRFWLRIYEYFRKQNKVVCKDCGKIYKI